MNNDTGIRYVVIDFSSLLKSYSCHLQLYTLYSRYPLPEIIRTILSVSAYDGLDNDMFWTEIYNRFDNDVGDMNIDIVDLFYDVLTQDVDETIRQKLPGYDSGCFVFKDWVGDTSMVLEYENLYGY